MPALIQVNVSSRSATTDKRRRGPFWTRTARSVEREAPTELSFDPEVKVTRVSARPRTRTRTRGPQLEFESELDCTTYNCGCGFVFQAAVLTSVACPHCGDSQAW